MGGGRDLIESSRVQPLARARVDGGERGAVRVGVALRLHEDEQVLVQGFGVRGVLGREAVDQLGIAALVPRVLDALAERWEKIRGLCGLERVLHRHSPASGAIR